MEDTQSAPVFNPADYPRRYVYETPLLAWAAGYLVVIASFFAGAYVLTYHSFQQGLPENYVVFSLIGLMMAALLAILMVHRTEVEMSADEIRVINKFTNRTLKRQDIKGWRSGRSWLESGDFIFLAPLDSRNRALRIKKDDLEALEVDEAFHRWYQSLLALDQQQKDEYYDQVATTETLGRTRDERLKNMAFAVRVLNRFRYFFIAAFTLLLVLPNAYLPPLTDGIAITFGLLTVLGVIVIYRCPILLTEPPIGLGQKTYSPFLIVSGWGTLLSLWFVRDSLMERVWPDLFELQINACLIGIFLVIVLPLFADRNLTQFPKRVLWDLYCALLALCTFYFYANAALDRAIPVITVTTFEENFSWDRTNTTPYILDRNNDVEGKIIDGCHYKFPGAFGPPWNQLTDCPENFQKPAPPK